MGGPVIPRVPLLACPKGSQGPNPATAVTCKVAFPTSWDPLGETEFPDNSKAQHPRVEPGAVGHTA